MTSLGQSLGWVGTLTAGVATVALVACTDAGVEGGESGAAGVARGGSAGSGGSGTSGTSGTGGAAGSSGASGSNGTGQGGAAGSGGNLGNAGTTPAAGTGGTGTGGIGTGGSSGNPGTGGSSAGTGATGGIGAGGLAGSGATSGSGGSGAAGGSGGSGGNGGSGGSMDTCPPATPVTGGMEYCSNTKGDAGNNYGFELWAEGSGSGCMTVHRRDATFSAEWNNVEDFLARVGLDFDRTRRPAQIGNIRAEFAHTKTEEGEGLTYIGIYGWTVDPLREYYILDDWGAVKPAGTASDGSPRTSVGTLTADGETYDVWMKTRMNKPAITGDNMTFDQYFSIRRTPRQCGTISVSEHFEKWIELGLDLGNLVEVKLLLEAQFNSGSAKFTTAKVVVD